ncbi:leucine-rich repeat-domain-containing protein [Obelidium mucronatum]|nr:leucine-rich repeat-domain-containing protein [Obelidium mucronatum]
MTRLRSLLVSNNRISTISETLPKQIPNLENLIASNNQIMELGDLNVLAEFKGLIRVAFLGNPVCTRKNYRAWIIFKCPTVRVIDFRKVKDVERVDAKALFSGSTQAHALASETAARVTTFTPGDGVPAAAAKPALKPHAGPSPDEAQRIKAAIESAASLEDVARLKRQLDGGSVPAAKKAK